MKTQKSPQDLNQSVRKNRSSWRAAAAATGSRTRKLPLLLALAVVLLGASSARATIMVNASEVGSDVVFTLSGGVDLASLTDGGATGGFPAVISPTAPLLSFGTGSGSHVYLVSNLITPPGNNFGTGGQSLPSSVTGTTLFTMNFGVQSPNLLFSPGFAGSGLNGIMTFNSASFSSLGLTIGTYEWDWSNGNNTGNIILNIGQSVPGTSVPDTGSTLALLALGAGGVVALQRRRGLAA